MQKIPTIFVRDTSSQPALVTPVWTTGCEWVRDGEGMATVKHDGSCCLVRDGVLYKRREVKRGRPAPEGFELVETDERTGKSFGWVLVGDGAEDRWHREAFPSADGDGTYELMGPKVQGNPEALPCHVLVRHGMDVLEDVPRHFEGLRDFLAHSRLWMEGIVFWHEDGRKGKIKRRDFGIPWPVR